MLNSVPPMQLRESDATLLRQTIHHAVSNGKFIRGCEPVISNLLHEVGRATIVPEATRQEAASLGSRLALEILDTGEEIHCRLVAPDQANMAEGDFSILSPLGAALIGRCPGEVVTYGLEQEQARIVTVAPSA